MLECRAVQDITKRHSEKLCAPRSGLSNILEVVRNPLDSCATFSPWLAGSRLWSD